MVQSQVKSRLRSHSNNSNRSKSGRVDNIGERSEFGAHYNVNPTKLFSYIDQSRWEKAIERVRKVPSEAGTWLVSRGPCIVQFRYLPLHLCLQFNPPYAAVEAVVQAYEEAVTKRDHEGKLPLHHICHSSSIASVNTDRRSDDRTSEAIVRLLVSLYPASIHERDNNGRSCFDIMQNVILKEGKTSRSDAILRTLREWSQRGDTSTEYRDDTPVARRVNIVHKDESNQFNDTVHPDQSVARLVVREVESALLRAKDDKEELRRATEDLRQDNDKLKNKFRKLVNNLDETWANTKHSGQKEKGIIELYERQMEELNQDNDECRNILKEQTTKFEAKLRSLTKAHEETSAEMNSRMKKHEVGFKDQISSMKAQLKTACLQVKAHQSEEDDWRAKYSALETQKEDWKIEAHRVQQGFKEKEQKLLHAFETRQFQLGAELKSYEAKINSLQKVIVAQEGELDELRTSHNEMIKKEHQTKAAYEKNVSMLEEAFRSNEAKIASSLATRNIQDVQLQEIKARHETAMHNQKSYEAKIKSLHDVTEMQAKELNETKGLFEQRNKRLEEAVAKTKILEKTILQQEEEVRQQSNATQRVQVTNNGIQQRMMQLETELTKRENIINNLQKANASYDEDLRKQKHDAEEKLEATSQSFFAALQEHETNKSVLTSQMVGLKLKLVSLGKEVEELAQEKQEKEQTSISEAKSLHAVKTRHEEELKNLRLAAEAKLNANSQHFIAIINDLEAEKRDLTSMLVDMDSKVVTLEKELASEQNKIESLKEVATTHELDPTANETKILQLEETIKILESKREHLKDAMSKNNDTFQTKVKALSEKRKSLGAEVTSLKARLSQIEEEKCSLNEELEECKGKLQAEKLLASARNSAEVSAERKHARVQSELREEIANLQGKNIALEDRLHLLRVSQGNTEAPNNEPKATMENYRLHISSLEKANEHLRQKIADSQSIAEDKAHLEKELIAFKNKAAHHEEEIRRLKEKLDCPLTNRLPISSLEKANEHLRQKITDFHSIAKDKAQLEKEIIALKNEAAHHEEEIRRLKEKSDDTLTTGVNTNTRREEELCLENKLIREKVQELEGKKAYLMAILERNGALYKKKFDEMKEEKKHLEKENEQLKQQTKKALEKVLLVKNKQALSQEEDSSNCTALLEKAKVLKESKDALETENKALQSQLLLETTPSIGEGKEDKLEIRRNGSIRVEPTTTD